MRFAQSKSESLSDSGLTPVLIRQESFLASQLRLVLEWQKRLPYGSLGETWGEAKASTRTLPQLGPSLTVLTDQEAPI